MLAAFGHQRESGKLVLQFFLLAHPPTLDTLLPLEWASFSYSPVLSHVLETEAEQSDGCQG